jgi:hypothetical protein
LAGECTVRPGRVCQAAQRFAVAHRWQQTRGRAGSTFQSFTCPRFSIPAAPSFPQCAGATLPIPPFHFQPLFSSSVRRRVADGGERG